MPEDPVPQNYLPEDYVLENYVLDPPFPDVRLLMDPSRRWSSMEKSIQVSINGQTYERKVEPRLLLVHFLREVLSLTGTHIGCETTVCGACTVMLDGRAVKSCSILAVQADGKAIITVEGLAENGQLHAVQEAFWNEHGLQCGFCTPGMIIAVEQLLRDNPNPSRDEIRHGIEGNLCRCTGYQNIVSAVEAAAKAKGAGA